MLVKTLFFLLAEKLLAVLGLMFVGLLCRRGRGLGMNDFQKK